MPRAPKLFNDGLDRSKDRRMGNDLVIPVKNDLHLKAG